MGKVQCIFGDIYFSRNIAFVYHIDKKEYIEAELAEEYCQKKIESNEHQTYVIPDLYYSDVRGDKGKVDYRFCDNNPKRKKGIRTEEDVSEYIEKFKRNDIDYHIEEI